MLLFDEVDSDCVSWRNLLSHDKKEINATRSVKPGKGVRETI